MSPEETRDGVAERLAGREVEKPMHRNHLARAAAGAAAFVLFCVAPAADAARVVHLAGEYTTSGPAAPGWSYLWNANGPLGTAANYVPLVRDTSGDWETVANG